ncbi:MAG: hypothetical protein M0T81_03620 [Thermoplasmatales archaeon]|nr:hypothetical protein [Thermoplasmatales archaeon]
MSETRSIDFDTVKEVWNSYELNDKNTIMVKSVVTNILKKLTTDYVTGFPEYVGQVNTVVRVSSKTLNKDKTGEIPSKDTWPSIPKEQMRVKKVLKEDWNAYEVDDGYIFQLKPVVVDVYKFTDLFDQNGLPFYVVQTIPVGRTVKKNVDK